MRRPFSNRQLLAGQVLLILALLAPLILLLRTGGAIDAGAARSAGINGFVHDSSGPVSGARVRVRATDNLTFSSEDGRFLLSGLKEGMEVEVTAWYDGYYIASTYVTPPAADVVLTIRPYHTVDHPSYAWADPRQGDGACGNCHPSVLAQWAGNAHSAAVDNARFFSLYNGTDLDGTEPAGSGYLLDFPGTAGNCAECHAPGAAADAYLTTNMNEVRGETTAGIHCDFCHKAGGVYLDGATGSVYSNAPGVRSQRLLRPPPGDNIFFGPYDDVHDPDTYLPLISESRFCAPCHQFSFWGTPIYESYNEWLASPYAEMGVTCQDCHMPPTGESYFAPPEVGGVAHPPEAIPSHLQLGAESEALLQESAQLKVSMEQRGRALHVVVQIENSGAGHHLPTDHPGRHLLLTVLAADESGRPLPVLAGPRVPDWGGDQAGLPGEAYAKILSDVSSGETPVVSYWKPTQIAADSRIPALGTAVSSYIFLLPEGSGAVHVAVELRFRRLFADQMVQKGWQMPDIIMARYSIEQTYTPQWVVFVPLVP